MRRITVLLAPVFQTSRDGIVLSFYNFVAWVGLAAGPGSGPEKVKDEILRFLVLLGNLLA